MTGSDAIHRRPWHGKKRFRMPLLVVAIVVLAVVAIAWIVAARVLGRAQGREMAAEEWRARHAADVVELQALRAQLQQGVAALCAMAEAAPADITTALAPEERQRAREYWALVYDAARQIDARADFHRDFVLWFAGKRRDDYVRGFLLCDAADLIVHDAGLQVSAAMLGNARWASLLNEEQPAMGLPARSFDEMNNAIVNPERTARQFLAHEHYKQIKAFASFDQIRREPEGAWLVATVEELHPRVHEMLKQRGVELGTRQARAVGGGILFTAWFPVQKNVANAMGNVRFKKAGEYLATPEQIRELRARMQPGDIALTRRNWYLSNAGIPGFWPHATLHLGSAEELAAFFDDDAVRAWVQSVDEQAGDFCDLLARRHPEAWADYTTPLAIPEWGTEQKEFIEAIAQGVVMRPAIESIHADAIGVMRPRLPKVELARAIDRAFSHWRKPYDYNFDFGTDNALVCSELVFKCYQPSADFRGLRLGLVETMGRALLPPNEIVRKLDGEWGSAERELDFVAFLDAREDLGRSEFGTLEDFRATWRRPKWLEMPR